jgi:hypothetical protein
VNFHSVVCSSGVVVIVIYTYDKIIKYILLTSSHSTCFLNSHIEKGLLLYRLAVVLK